MDNPPVRVLIVDDDRNFCASVGRYLETPDIEQTFVRLYEERDGV